MEEYIDWKQAPALIHEIVMARARRFFQVEIRKVAGKKGVDVCIVLRDPFHRGESVKSVMFYMPPAQFRKWKSVCVLTEETTDALILSLLAKPKKK